MKRLFKHEENTDIISKRRNKKIFQKRNEEKEKYRTNRERLEDIKEGKRMERKLWKIRIYEEKKQE